MQPGFVIMQIGNPELEVVYERVVAPAFEDCGLEARRMDRDNRGGLLVSEIVCLIEEAEMVEGGYVLGVGKLTNPILTARADHDLECPTRRPGGPRVHFDVAGSEILYWQRERLDDFRRELEKRVRRRQGMLR